MRRWIWIGLFAICAFADVRVPLPWSAGIWETDANPAKKWEGFRLGLLWTEPMEDVDYEVVGFAAEWGGKRYRLQTVFVSAFLDSIYRSENFELSGALHWNRFSIGAGGTAEIQIVPGEASWARFVGRTGISAELISHISVGAWGIFPSDFEENSYGGEIFWEPSSNFRSGIALLYRKPKGWMFGFMQKMRLGVLEFQGEVVFPGPKIGVGIAFNWEGIGASFGVHRDADYMNSKMAGLFWNREK
ncbi:MAG: hypothetical protein SOZ02_10395 [Hallerella porci]|uniref:hypothetical protein n=1 Tax=Hallerella porci TaxID=1945871 RepID=UPI002A82555B|nr:hypothetical protein [Hallerella porci]MDY3922552.1 hypothetical protein [Hallerella porci]